MTITEHARYPKRHDGAQGYSYDLLVKRILQSPLVTVVCFKLLLHRENLLVPLIQPLSQRNHDVTLLEQEVLVSVDLIAKFASRHFNFGLTVNDAFEGGGR